jgi:hypothetical protein
MKLIYFGNGEYNSDSNNIIEIIQHINENNDHDIVIYGGNYKNDQSNNKENNIGIFLNSINTLLNNKTNLIMFGDYDLSDKSILDTEINFYKKTNKFQIFNDLVSMGNNKNNFVIENTLGIMFDSNLLLVPNPNDILVTDTIYENLFDNFSKNINKEKNKKIKDLIDYQFDSILNVINNNPNVKNIIFITQNPLVSSNSNYNLIQFYEWISDVYFKLNYFNLYWLCSNSPNFESKIVNISIGDMNILNVSEYNVGVRRNISTHNNVYDVSVPSTNQTYTNNIAITSKLTNKTQELILSYQINKTSNNLGYLVMQKNMSEIDFVEINNQSNELTKSTKSTESTDSEFDFNFNIDLIVEKKDTMSKSKSKSMSKSKSKSKSSKYLKQYENIIKNVELSEISNVNTSEDINSELSDPDDPYKARYIKYKIKLFELRKNKKNKKNII